MQSEERKGPAAQLCDGRGGAERKREYRQPPGATQVSRRLVVFSDIIENFQWHTMRIISVLDSNTVGFFVTFFSVAINLRFETKNQDYLHFRVDGGGGGGGRGWLWHLGKSDTLAVTSVQFARRLWQRCLGTRNRSCSSQAMLYMRGRESYPGPSGTVLPYFDSSAAVPDTPKK